MFFSGEEAKRVFNDAQKLLNEIIDKKLLVANAVVAFYPAKSVGDDIILYDPNDLKKEIGTLYGIRQQVAVNLDFASLL